MKRVRSAEGRLKGRKAAAVLCALISLYLCLGAQAGQAFEIRQEKTDSGGVLVSRPLSIDLKISDVLLRNGIGTIEAYGLWLENNACYEADGEKDTLLAPRDMLAKLAGDCEDFAFLNAAVLSVLGYEAKVALLTGGLRSKGHAICYFVKDGKFCWFDNNRLEESNIATYEEFTGLILGRSGYGLFREA